MSDHAFNPIRTVEFYDQSTAYHWTAMDSDPAMTGLKSALGAANELAVGVSVTWGRLTAPQDRIAFLEYERSSLVPSKSI
jgi:hypothetical protein